jgi:hypothetical protein
VSWCLSLLCTAAIGVFATNSARAQSAAQEEERVSPTAADQAEAEEATVVYRHVRPATTPAGSALKQKDITARRAASTSPATTSSTTDNDQLRYPADLINLGGPVLTTAESHAIYLIPGANVPHRTCSTIKNCWGDPDPETFLGDLSGSDFVHLVDQYLGMGGSYSVSKTHTIMYYMPSKTAFKDKDLQAIVHAVVAKNGLGGYEHIYHVFLPRGQDVCLPANSSDPDDAICYSPDLPKNFAFCAYHNSVTFKDKVGHVLYTVEPFQDVSGCSVAPGTPNGQLADSTYNSLSHETVETITDPDGTAWINFAAVALAGAEIGDECSFFVVIPTSATTAALYFDPSVVMLGSRKYAIQPEYSNMEHACATSR